MRRGEVWWAAPRLPGGSRKRRPFLVVFHDAFNRNDRYPTVLAVHVTSVRRPGGPFAWEVALPAGAAGRRKPGVVECGKVYTLLKNQLEAVSGTLDRESMEQVDRALSIALNLLRGARGDAEFGESWPDGYWEDVVGGWTGDPIPRPPQGELEERQAVGELD